MSITLGNFSSITNPDGSKKNVLFGAGGSGLDTQTLIASLVAIRSQPATNDQTQITANGKISDALNQFQSLLSSFQSSADALRNPPGVGNEANNAFDFTTGSVGNGGSTYVSVTTSPGAALQSYNISNISSLATAAAQTTGIFNVASANASAVSANPISGSPYQFAPGTITFSDGQTITLHEGDSLNAVANDFNSISGITGVGATVIQIDATHYQLSFNAASTGTANNFNLANNTTITSDPSGVLGNIGLTEQQSTGIFTIASPSVIVASNSNITGSTGIQFTPGMYSVNGHTVTISEGDTLTQVASDFNTVAGTGVTAHIVKAGTNQYKLTFTQNPGAGALAPLNLAATLTGVSMGSIVAATTPTAGTDAIFKINGISITRSTNNINDVISGLTFNLLQTTPGGSNTAYPVTISPDTTTIQNSIVGYVNAYNALKTFAAQQTQLNSDGTYAATAILANNPTFRQTMDDINQKIISQVSGLTGTITSLSDVGITFTKQAATSTTPEVDNILTVNDGQLASALSSNFQAVNNLFGFHLTSNNAALTVFSETNALAATAFTLNNTGGVFTATIGSNPPITLTATLLPGGEGYFLSGPAGSALDGLEMIYASTADATISVGVTQGVADKTFNTSNAATTANTGTLAVALKGIQTNNTTLTNDITRVNAQVTQYQQQLLNEFAALEQAISNTNTLINGITANQNAALTASGH